MADPRPAGLDAAPRGPVEPPNTLAALTSMDLGDLLYNLRVLLQSKGLPEWLRTELQWLVGMVDTEIANRTPADSM